VTPEKRAEPLEESAPVGTIGYTTSYRDEPAGIEHVSVVAETEARGPE
jgi:hypothetical protein